MSEPFYEYLEAEVVTAIGKSANQWQRQGWETIAVIPPAGMSKSFSLLLKRAVPQNPFDREDSWHNWIIWETENHPDTNPYDHKTQRGPWHDWEDARAQRQAEEEQ